MSSIQIVPSSSIDQEKWDNCLTHAANGLIYASYHYLNHMADHWHGLIIGDYDVIMPLAWRQKWGIKYYYQPAFTQQLGYFGVKDIEQVESLVETINDFCSYGDVFFNYANQSIAKRLAAVQQTNLVIDLSTGYDYIYHQYNKDLQNNVRRAAKFELLYQPAEVATAIQIYQQWYGNRFTHVTAKDYEQFGLLCNHFNKKGQVFARDVIDGAGNLLAIGLFLKDEKRIYNVMNSTAEEGRKKEANTFLFDNIIQEFAGEDLLFDFEGSDLPGVKQFYQKFGAVPQPFFHWHHNNLPYPLKLLKK
jgi:hypothetical protein